MNKEQKMYQKKFNELDAEIKDQMLIDCKRKYILDQYIFTNTERKYRNLKIARRIEQVLKSYRPKGVCLDALQDHYTSKENQCAIFDLNELFVKARIGDDTYQIDGYVDDQSIVHIKTSKVAHDYDSSCYTRQLNDDVHLRVTGDFGLYLECAVNVHESQLEQSIVEALDTLQRKYAIQF